LVFNMLSMKDNFQKELSGNNYFLLKYGYLVIIIIVALLIWALFIVKINNVSILQMIERFYYR
jgi:hypothetical protein